MVVPACSGVWWWRVLVCDGLVVEVADARNLKDGGRLDQTTFTGCRVLL